jgi:hypothetical protein
MVAVSRQEQLNAPTNDKRVSGRSGPRPRSRLSRVSSARLDSPELSHMSSCQSPLSFRSLDSLLRRPSVFYDSLIEYILRRRANTNATRKAKKRIPVKYNQPMEPASRTKAPHE